MRAMDPVACPLIYPVAGSDGEVNGMYSLMYVVCRYVGALVLPRNCG